MASHVALADPLASVRPDLPSLSVPAFARHYPRWEPGVGDIGGPTTVVGTREGAGTHGESVASVGRVISSGAWRRTGYAGGIWFIRAYNRTENELESSRFSIRGSGLPRPSTGSGDETVEVLSGWYGWYGLMNRYPVQIQSWDLFEASDLGTTCNGGEISNMVPAGALVPLPGTTPVDSQR